jgi:hypothetical protein
MTDCKLFDVLKLTFFDFSFTFKDLQAAEKFEVSYKQSDAGFSGEFDGYKFQEFLNVGSKFFEC